MRRTAVLGVVLLALCVAGCGVRHVPLAPPTTTAAAPAPAAASAADVASGPALSPPLTRRPAGRTIHVGALPDALAADPRAHQFAVAIHDPSRLALVDSRSGRVTQRVAVPVGQERHPAPAVFLVPAETGRHAVAVQPAPVTPAAAPQPRAALVLGRTFVTGPRGDSVDVLDGGRPTAHFGSAPAALASADFDTRLAVLSSARRTLELFDPRTLRVVATTPAGRRPTGIATFGDLVFVSDSDGDAVLAYSTRPRLHPVARIPVGGAPYALAVDPLRRDLYVTQPARNRLTTISIARFAAVSSLPTVRQPDAVAVDSATGTIAVAGHRDGLLQLVTAERRDAGLTRIARRPD
ncbi:MAG TPA: hypothetical protein VI318_16900 [Baekduia sp.]